jgi:AAA family ATP:ADP antiporter
MGDMVDGKTETTVAVSPSKSPTSFFDKIEVLNEKVAGHENEIKIVLQRLDALEAAAAKTAEAERLRLIASEPSECLKSVGIRTWEEACKVLTVSCFCFTANTILLLGRNIGATMLLTGLSADALPYVMVLVGAFILVIMPLTAYLVSQSSSNTVLTGMTFVMIGILTGFLFMFQTGVAEEYPKIVYPMFFVVEEVVDSVLMVLFWQIGMLCFTKDEAKRLIGIVNMGAALANLANGVTVAVLIHYFSAFAILPAQMVLLLLQLIPNVICRRWIPDTESKKEEKKSSGPVVEKNWCDADAWYMNSFTQLIGVWQFITVLIFSTIEFQYNSTLANFLDANGIAQVTANLASVASVGQTFVNLLITPFLLQVAGTWAALLVTPIAYVAGEFGIMTDQTVRMVFICRSMDFIFRYTVSDNTKQILYKSVPPHQLIDARAFTDGSIKKLAPMLLGGILIVVQGITGLGAYELVFPMAVFGVGASGGLIPLVLYLAKVSEAQPNPELL